MCEFPRKGIRANWALRRGCRYAKKRENFIPLCPLCHKRYDLGIDIFDKGIVFTKYQLSKAQVKYIKHQARLSGISESTLLRKIIDTCITNENKK